MQELQYNRTIRTCTQLETCCFGFAPALRLLCSMSIGDNSILGDDRWGGLFGIRADFIAIDDVKVLYLSCSSVAVALQATCSHVAVVVQLCCTSAQFVAVDSVKVLHFCCFFVAVVLQLFAVVLHFCCIRRHRQH